MKSPKHIVKLFLVVAAAMAILFATASNAHADPVPAGTDDEIAARLTPFGNLCRAGDDCGGAALVAVSTAQSGSDVYNQFCFACHTTGASDAPLFADAEAWEPRLAKGMETLMASTLNGLGMMPPKGTCMACSDEELQAAVEYMVTEVQ
ncbi:MAG: cytochrome c5 family protein [Pseudomonadales bacterium]